VGDERDDDDKGDEEGGSSIPSRIDQSRLDSSDQERAPPLIAWCSCSSFGRAYDGEGVGEERRGEEEGRK